MIVESPRGAVRAKAKVTDAIVPAVVCCQMAVAGLFGDRSDRLQIRWAQLCQSEPAHSFSRLRSVPQALAASLLSLSRRVQCDFPDERSTRAILH
jgi:hypothetical protein